MNPDDRILFIIGVAVRLVIFALACVAALTFVGWHWFVEDDKFTAVFGMLVASLILPFLTPDGETLQTWRHLLQNRDN